MTGEDAAPGRPRRPTPEERRARRAEVDDPALVLDAGARFLEARPRSEAEVRRRLTGAGYRAELVEAALARLTELGYLDDEAFARAWVESRDRAHPRGEHALMLELRRLGIAAPIVAATLRERREAAVRWEPADAPDPVGGEPGAGEQHARGAGPAAVGADDVAAERLLARNARALARVADPRLRRQRAYALLARNGFSPDVCADVSRRATVEPPSIDDEPA